MNMTVIRCGNCKAEHSSVDEVRDCFGNPKVANATEAQINYAQMLLRTREPGDRFAWLTDDQVNNLSKSDCSDFIGYMKERPLRARSTDDFDLPHPEVPVGRYALTGGDEIVRFYEVVDKHGRALLSLRGAPGALARSRIKRRELAEEVMAEIAKDPRAASLLYGMKLEECGVCGSPLTNDVSRAAGIGPVCASKKGW